jgi:hypothetical protein
MVDAFLQRNPEAVAEGGRGRLTFAIEEAQSRERTWAFGTELQAQMFTEAAKVGGLQVQLDFFRDSECRASEWTSYAARLTAKMRGVSCVGGLTQ